MPPAHPGEFIMWSSDGTESSMRPAVVVRVNTKSVDGYVFGAGNRGGMRHVDDPRVKRNPDQIVEFGVWKHADAGRRMVKIEELIVDLTARVAALESHR